ncbi:MAG: DUF4159 domain-containing protein [Planctomycetes bacterium]|nr:DUF4159 domain-containing protein [Planctomycetota bacterium]
MTRMRCTLLLAWLAAGFAMPGSAHSQDILADTRITKEGKTQTVPDVSSEQVRRAIERGISYLRDQQKRNGSFLELAPYKLGSTGLCALALMEAGVDPQDPAIRRALDFIRSAPAEFTYDVALQTMALCRAGAASDLPTVRRNVQWLERAQKTDGDDRGAWGYTQGAGPCDNSNAQFALLALYDAQQAGVPVNPETWKQALLYWERTRNPDGSWGYKEGGPGRGTMTSAGISSLVIAGASVHPDDAKADGGACRCTEHQQNNSLENALRWLGDHFRVEHNPGTDKSLYRYYFLYGLERAGRLSGRRFLVPSVRGEGRVAHDWYRSGTNSLVNSQDASGFWKGSGMGEDNEHIATSFALLFLSKGRRPVLVSKLQRAGDWNLLRHDLAHLTGHAEQEWKMPLTWQVIDGGTATVDDYAQTPVLFISGSDALRITDAAQKQRLRTYVEQGGFIFADACCAGGAFEKSFRELMEEIFPEPHLRLRPLDVDHPIWTMDHKVSAKFIDPQSRWLYGIDVGCRTSVVMSTGNLSCYWELDRMRREQPLPAATAADVAAARALGLNVLAYATNRQLKKKDEIPRNSVVSDSSAAGLGGHLAVAKLRHAGGCDDAPRALSNLMEALNRSYQVHTQAKTPLLSITDESIFNYHFLYMQGRNDFRLSDAEVQQLRTFIERGGTVFADALCASPAFAEAFRREMRRVFPGQGLRRIAVDDPIFSPAYGGSDVTKVTRREALRRRQGEPMEIKLRQGVEPELEGIKLKDRYAILFSPFDISCALEKQASPQCHGYTPEDAARIAINVLLYTLHE